MSGWTPVLLQARNVDFGPYGIWGILILILDIIVIVSVWRSHKAFIPKVVWTLVILFLPILGLILYFFLGREK